MHNRWTQELDVEIWAVRFRSFSIPRSRESHIGNFKAKVWRIQLAKITGLLHSSHIISVALLCSSSTSRDDLWLLAIKHKGEKVEGAGSYESIKVRIEYIQDVVYDIFIRYRDDCVLRKWLSAVVVARIQFESWMRELL